MKTKTKNRLLAALAVTAVLGAGIAVLSNSNNDFATDGLNLRGNYSLAAFAETSEAETKTVAGVPVDFTTTKSITSTDGQYLLFVSAIDVSDANQIADVVVGYNYNGKMYNGAYSETESGLSTAVYSTLTIGDVTLTVEEMFKNAINSASANFDKENTKLVITEVNYVNGATATLEIAQMSTYEHI